MTDPQIPVSTPTVPEPTPQMQGINILTPALSANPAVLFVMTYWKAIIFSLLFLFAGYEWLRIDSLKNQLIVAEAKTKTAEDELKNCRGEVKHLSDKVNSAAAESKRFQDLLKSLQPQLDRIGRNTANAAKRIMDEKSPQTCEEINSYIIENQIDFTWKP